MNVSTAIKNAYKNNTYAKKLTVTFPNLNYTVPEDEVYYESMTLDEAIFDNDSWEAVGCISSQFSLSIRDTGENLKDELVVVTISLNGMSDSDIPLFYGYVDSVKREAQKKMQSITAYDPLYSKGSKEVANWYNALTFPITLKNFRDSLFNFIGITQQTTTLPNDSITINKEYTPNTMMALNVIRSLCQINGCFGMMNRQGTFEYRYLVTHNQGAVSEQVSYYRSMDYSDYTVNPVDKLTIRHNTEDTGVTVGSGNNEYIIQGNMFTYNLSTETIYTIANNIYPFLYAIEYVPFNGVNNGYPWIEMGDNCALTYSVYDFDNSTSSQSVYKTVNVVAMKRTMKGIQNLIDSYNAEGQELQQEFISDISVDLDILQQTVNEIKKKMSSEITTYRNSNDILIYEGHPETIADLVYEANQGNTVIFHEEVSLVATESVGTQQTIGDVVGTVRYYVNGYMLPNRTSEDTFVGGKNLLNLMQFWEAGSVSPSRFQAKLEVKGGSISISKFRAGAYITAKQSDYYDAAIEVTRLPDKIIYRPGEQLDFTGLVISKVYHDESKPSENITALCTFVPTEGTTMLASEDMIIVYVTYTEISELGEEKTYRTEFNVGTQYLVGINVEHEPNKSEYFIGEALDLSGIVVIADYVDGTSADVTAQCTFSPNDGYVFNNVNEGAINISYSEDGFTRYAQTSVTVQESVLEEIEVTTMPTKTEYEVYEHFNYSGIVITAKYTNGSTQVVTPDCTFDPENGTLVEEDTSTTVEVTYTENNITCNTSFELMINELNFDLRYVIYTVDTEAHIISITGLNVENIVADNLDTLKIPDRYIINGVTYDVYIDD